MLQICGNDQIIMLKVQDCSLLFLDQHLILRFVLQDYKCTVEYYVSHFLVHESKARVGQKRVQTLRIDAIDHGSSRWRGADILIFNTAHWWSHFKTKAGLVPQAIRIRLYNQPKLVLLQYVQMK